MITRNLLIAGSLLFFYGSEALSEVPKNLCTYETCKAGTKAITYFKKSDAYYACPTRELANYVNTLVGLISMQAAFGVMPNVSDKTGEPEYEGETKALVDSLRTKAQVRTFDQGVAACALGENRRKVTVINMPPASSVAYVIDEKRQTSSWVPIFHLDKVK